MPSDFIQSSLFLTPFTRGNSFSRTEESRGDGVRVNSGGIAETLSEAADSANAIGGTARPFTLSLSNDALSLLSEAPDAGGITDILAGIDPTIDQPRKGALSFLAPFISAAAAGRPLTGVEASRVGDQFFNLNAAAGFERDPQALSQAEQRQLLRDVSEFDAITERASASPLTGNDRRNLNQLTEDIADRLGFQLRPDEIANVVRQTLERTPDTNRLDAVIAQVGSVEGVTNRPENLRQSEQEALTRDFARFEQITRGVDVTDLSARDRSNLDTVVETISERLGFTFRADELALVIQSALASAPQAEVALFDATSGLSPLRGDDVAGILNDLESVNRGTDFGADLSNLSDQQLARLESLLTEFNIVVASSGSSLLFREQVQAVTTSAANAGGTLALGAGTQIFSENTSARPGLSAFEQFIGSRSDDNPLVIALR